MLACFIEREALGLSKQAIASVVDDDVETTEMFLGRRKRSRNLPIVHNVELLDKQLLVGVFVLQVRKDFRFAEGRDDPFATGEDSFDEAFAEAGRSSSNCEKSPLSMCGRSGCREHVLNQTLVFAKAISEEVLEQSVGV